ncbi:hypothetical protein HDV05_000236, partial [Chytridiales sp. JEL 0842]
MTGRGGDTGTASRKKQARESSDGERQSGEEAGSAGRGMGGFSSGRHLIQTSMRRMGGAPEQLPDDFDIGYLKRTVSYILDDVLATLKTVPEVESLQLFKKSLGRTSTSKNVLKMCLNVIRSNVETPKGVFIAFIADPEAITLPGYVKLSKSDLEKYVMETISAEEMTKLEGLLLCGVQSPDGSPYQDDEKRRKSLRKVLEVIRANPSSNRWKTTFVFDGEAPAKGSRSALQDLHVDEAVKNSGRSDRDADVSYNEADDEQNKSKDSVKASAGIS